MKKQNIIIPAIIIIIAAIIIIFTVPWNQVKEEQAAGTIGKVDKYQSEQMSERSVKLRTELIKDTSLLFKTIKELISFTIFSNETIFIIETWWIPELKKYYSTSKSQTNIKELEDYVSLLKNNNQTLQDVIQILGEFYAGTNKDQTVDVEGKLISFSNFVNQMAQRDSVFDAIIIDIDQTIKDSKDLKLRKEVIAKLKAIRDRILIDNLVYAFAIGDNKKANFAANQFFYNINNIMNQLSSYAASLSLYHSSFASTVYSNPVIQSLLQNKNLENINNQLFGLGGLSNGIPANKILFYEIIPNALFNKEAIKNLYNQESVGRLRYENQFVGLCMKPLYFIVQNKENLGGQFYYCLLEKFSSEGLGSKAFFSKESEVLGLLYKYHISSYLMNEN